MKDEFKDLRDAEEAGKRIQVWHLIEGASNSDEGDWHTLSLPAQFNCHVHLYRVHPEDV